MTDNLGTIIKQFIENKYIFVFINLGVLSDLGYKLNFTIHNS